MCLNCHFISERVISSTGKKCDDPGETRTISEFSVDPETLLPTVTERRRDREKEGVEEGRV